MSSIKKEPGFHSSTTSIGWGGTEKSRLTAAAMVRNLTIMERLGGTTPEDLADMRRGKTATVRKGLYAREMWIPLPRCVHKGRDFLAGGVDKKNQHINRHPLRV